MLSWASLAPSKLGCMLASSLVYEGLEQQQRVLLSVTYFGQWRPGRLDWAVGKPVEQDLGCFSVEILSMLLNPPQELRSIIC